MFGLLTTLVKGADARANDALRSRFALDLIEQHLREGAQQITQTKSQLAALMLQAKQIKASIESLDADIEDMTGRAKEALAAKHESLAHDAATAIAEFHNERATRQAALVDLEGRIMRLKTSVERAQRKLSDLRQAQIVAKSARTESAAYIGKPSGARVMPLTEAEALINDVMGETNPFEMEQMMEEIDHDLNPLSARDRLEAAGFGPKTKMRAEDVLKSLSNQS